MGEPIASFRDLEPAQREAAIRRLEALVRGELRRPQLRCGRCGSEWVYLDPEENDRRDATRVLLCVACGKLTDYAAAKVARARELVTLILDG